VNKVTFNRVFCAVGFFVLAFGCRQKRSHADLQTLIYSQGGGIAGGVHFELVITTDPSQTNRSYRVRARETFLVTTNEMTAIGKMVESRGVWDWKEDRPDLELQDVT
jgi:hypothetical protein